MFTFPPCITQVRFTPWQRIQRVNNAVVLSPQASPGVICWLEVGSLHSTLKLFVPKSI